jgi:hypothetical protein
MSVCATMRRGRILAVTASLFGRRISLIDGTERTYDEGRQVMEKRKIAGTVLAATVGMMFLAQPIFADDSAKTQGTNSSSVKCVGGNSCKGQSSCMSASNSCKGQNACKGKGWVTAASADDCSQKGGHADKD